MNQVLKLIENLIKKGSYREAEEKTSDSNLSEPNKLAVLGSIALKENIPTKAEVYFTKALQLEPNNKIAIANYGQFLVTQKQFKRALDLCKRAHEENKKHEGYLLNYVACLADIDDFKRASEILEEHMSLTERPTLQVMLSAASVERALLNPTRSLEILGKAKELYPDEVELQRAIADAYSELDPRTASREFEKAVKSSKKLVALKWNWSFVELRLGNFQKGWELYESGLERSVGKVGRPLPAVMNQFPLITRLDDINPDKYTLFTAEQGIGDQILFLGCYDELLSRVSKPVLICEKRLVSILRRSFKNAEVHTYGFANAMSTQKELLAGVFPIGSLMKHFRKTPNDFESNRKRYIWDDETHTRKIRDRINKIAGGRPIVGLSWSGGHWDRQKKAKSLEFEELTELIHDRDECFISLQYGDVSAAMKINENLRNKILFIKDVDFKNDLETWLCLLALCDRLISCSTAIVHFAGAMCTPTKLILGSAQSPFIWGLDEGISLPYESVEIYRQQRDESRKEYLTRIKEFVFR